MNARLYPFLYLSSVASFADILWLQGGTTQCVQFDISCLQRWLQMIMIVITAANHFMCLSVIFFCFIGCVSFACPEFYTVLDGLLCTFTVCPLFVIVPFQIWWDKSLMQRWSCNMICYLKWEIHIVCDIACLPAWQSAAGESISVRGCSVT